MTVFCIFASANITLPSFSSLPKHNTSCFSWSVRTRHLHIAAPREDLDFVADWRRRSSKAGAQLFSNSYRWNSQPTRKSDGLSSLSHVHVTHEWCVSPSAVSFCVYLCRIKKKKRHIWPERPGAAVQTHVTAFIRNSNAAIWVSSCVLPEQITLASPRPASPGLCGRELMLISFGMYSAGAPPPISQVFIG